MKHRTHTHHVEDRDGLRVPVLLEREGRTEAVAELDAMFSTLPHRRHGDPAEAPTVKFPRILPFLGAWATDRAVPIAVTA